MKRRAGYIHDFGMDAFGTRFLTSDRISISYRQFE